MYSTIAYSVMFVRVCVNSYFVLLLNVECWCSRNFAIVFILVISGLFLVTVFHVISGYCRTCCCLFSQIQWFSRPTIQNTETVPILKFFRPVCHTQTDRKMGHFHCPVLCYTVVPSGPSCFSETRSLRKKLLLSLFELLLCSYLYLLSEN